MLKRSLITGLVLVAAATPAFALYCEDDRGGVSITFGSNLDTGGGYTESELNNLDLMQLRQQGVDATAVERWNGCIRAFVRKPEGGEEMQFFDPNNFRRLQ